MSWLTPAAGDHLLLAETDIDASVLLGRRIAVLGYGSQGRAQALSLRDGGWSVRVGVRAGGPSEARAREDGIDHGDPLEVARWGNVVMMLVPDEHQPALLDCVAAALEPGDAVGFAHGFNVTYDRAVFPAGVRVFLVAPCAPGARLREAFEAGKGVFAYVAVRDGDDDTLPLALAYALAIGCARAGVLTTTFREETEVDLFGEQAVLCGGLHALLTAGYETLVDAGYSAEMAYLETLHQIVWLAATIQREGIAGTRRLISSTARYGDVTRGSRIIGAESKQAFRDLLEEIRSGAFADEFSNESRRGFADLRRNLERLDRHPMEEVGSRLRERLARQAAVAPETSQGSGG